MGELANATAHAAEAEFKSAGTNDPQTRLILRADREASWEKVARVMSFARQANLTAVRAFTKQGP